PLPHQQIARAVLHQSTLLLGRLDLHKTHGRPPNCLADRCSVGRVILVALDVSLHVLRRHQPNLVAEPRQLTRPIVRRGASLHADQAARQRREKLHHLSTPKLLPDNHLLGCIDAVDLEHVLSDIQTDRGNLHVDGSPHVIRSDEPLYGTSMPGAGAVHHIKGAEAIKPTGQPVNLLPLHSKSGDHLVRAAQRSQWHLVQTWLSYLTRQKCIRLLQSCFYGGGGPSESPRGSRCH